MNKKSPKKTVVLGFLGSQLDAGMSAERWNRWRPSVSLAQQDDVSIDQFILFYIPNNLGLLQLVEKDIHTASPETQVIPIKMPFHNPWDFGEVYGQLYDWASHYTFDVDHVDYWVHITTGTHVVQICWFLLVEARLIPGILVQTSPPRRSTHPKRDDEHLQRKTNTWVGSYETIDLDLSKYDALAMRLAQAQQDAWQVLKSGIATRNSAYNQMISEIETVASRSNAPMLLMGPTGAGKSHLAGQIYALKKQRHLLTGPLVDVNCATLRGDGAASALFGHIKGAYTGAGSERLGLLRTAHKGLLFLDEIGELGLDEQAMLLKAIEEQRFFPLGSDVSVHSQFTLVAGTNRDLRLEVAQGRFRADLFARINLWTYHLPGLAHRLEDFEPNMDHLLVHIGKELGYTVRFNAEARQRYLAFAHHPDARWTGNFRDLHASITRLCTLATQGRITTELVQAEIERLRQHWHTPTPSSVLDDLRPWIKEDEIDEFDAIQLRHVIHVCQKVSSLSEAGRRLFGFSRTQRKSTNDSDRLRKYLERFGLSWEQIHPL